VAEDTFHVGEHGGTDERGEGVGDEVAAEENGVAECEFASCVPFRENEEGAGEEGGFDETDEDWDGWLAGVGEYKIATSGGWMRDQVVRIFRIRYGGDCNAAGYSRDTPG
jgi:hypothetical protein